MKRVSNFLNSKGQTPMRNQLYEMGYDWAVPDKFIDIQNIVNFAKDQTHLHYSDSKAIL
jgi:hypothetical protein